jgi:cation transport regulator ChaC
MYYFGYGSNMLTPRLRARVPSADPVMTGTLEGRTLRFHKQSQDGSGKCNVAPASGNDRVHGVVFDVSSSDLSTLDEAEQRGHGYERQDVTVHGPSQTVEAFAYVAQSAYVDDALRPYEWYHALVLAGAREHALPPSYVAQLEAVQARPDPNQRRRRTHQPLLRRAGFSLLEG